MKKTKKLVLFLMMFVMLMASGAVASAKVKMEYQVTKERMNRILGMEDGKPGADVRVYFDKNDKVKVSATSSNKKVAAVYVDEGEYGERCTDVWVIAKKPGKSTITIKVTANGKTTKKTLKYNFTEYKNPFTSFKVSGKDKTSQFNKLKKRVSSEDKSVYWLFDGKIEAGKLSYKLNSRYKIISFWGYRYGNDDTEELKITNNFVLKKKDYVFIQYKDLKTKTYGFLTFKVS